MKKALHVAVGVLLSTNKDVLLAKRHKNAHQGGLWEFPGGKVEAGENVLDALKREFKEEVGVEVEINSADSFLRIEHSYSDKSVLLDVWLASDFKGEASGQEGQEVKWVAIKDLPNYDFPAANEPIIKKLLDFI